MKILMAHNFYQHRGGEGYSFQAESSLLESRGHKVVRYTRDNAEIAGYGLTRSLDLPVRAIWARDSYRELRALLEQEQPDLVHFQNTFPLISPAAYYACKRAGVPVVQSLRNYRLMCANVIFRRSGRICEDCLGKAVPWPAVLHRCYRGSRASSAAVALMLTSHRAAGTWSRAVNIYIALTEFAREKFVQGGLPPHKLMIRPNLVFPDPGVRDGEGDYALYAGRLSEEKGLNTLLRAWRGLPHMPLKIAGAGPLEPQMSAFCRQHDLRQVELLGRMDHSRTLQLMKGARFLVVPSEWYEGFSRVILEAFACGVPVLASRLGSLQEIVADGTTGYLFEPGEVDDLASMADQLWAHSKRAQSMGSQGRREYEIRYAPEQIYRQTMQIYSQAQKRSRGN